MWMQTQPPYAARREVLFAALACGIANSGRGGSCAGAIVKHVDSIM